MARSVVISPPRVVRVLAVARRQPLENVIEIADRPRLELDGGDRGGGSDDEDRGDAGALRRRPNRGSGQARHVVRVALPLRLNAMSLAMHHAHNATGSTRSRRP